MADADPTLGEVQRLAELEAGLLDGPGREEAESLAATDRGRAALAALARVRADLDTLPTPELPADFAARLRVRLDESAPAPATRARPATRRDRWARSTPWVVGAAAASLALVTSVSTGLLRVDPSGSQAVSAGGGVTRDTASGGAPAAAVDTEGAEAGPAGAGPTAQTRDEAFPADGARVPLAASGRDYGRGDLPRSALDLAGDGGPAGRSAVGGAADSAVPGTPPTGAPVELARLVDDGALRSCLLGLGAGLADPLVVDYARFEGSPALVVIAATGSGAVTAYVVGPSCSASDPDLRHVLPS